MPTVKRRPFKRLKPLKLPEGYRGGADILGPGPSGLKKAPLGLGVGGVSDALKAAELCPGVKEPGFSLSICTQTR